MSRADLMGLLLSFIARLITGAQGHWKGCPPTAQQRIYFANHQSHLDWVLIWASLPKDLRATTRPIAAKDYWTAKRGLDALDPKWDDSKASTATSPAYEESLVAAVKAGGTIRVRRNTTVEAMTAEHGAAMAKASATVESIYTAPFLHHATMEPMNGTALVTERAAELWLPTQDQSTARKLVAELCGLPESAVTIHTMLSGGGFGRRIEPDFTMMAARIAKEMRGTPNLSAWCHTVSDCGSTPSTALKTTTAPSSTRRDRSTSIVKSTWPGVSIR